MKPISEITSCVVDYGCFIELAETMASKVKKSYYYSPYEAEYANLQDCCIGDGLDRVERLDEFLDPDVLKEIDLFLFPDVGGGGLQRHLREIGKAVWGSMGASELELYRTRFLKVIKACGLPVVQSVTIRGLTALAEHLKQVENKFIKVNRYRGNMETVRHRDYAHSLPLLSKLAMEFGGLREHVVFVVQDEIETDVELGYDGWYAGGFPSQSFQGLELKNELYLGFLKDNDDLPEAVRFVNEKFAPVLEKYGYRNFFASELRIKDDVAFFIDPTLRMAGQTQEHLLTSCLNLPEVIWAGANGELIEPDFDGSFAAEATLHYAGDCEDWKVMRVPDSVRPWVKLYQYAMADDLYHFPPHAVDEVGVVIGIGDSVEEAIDHLKENLEELKAEPVKANVEGFTELLDQAQSAEEQGINISDGPIPGPEILLENKP